MFLEIKGVVSAMKLQRNHFSPAVMFLFAVLMMSIHLRADTVTLKNGDRLTGTVMKLEGGQLVFKTAYAADPIVIAWDAVNELKLDHPMVLTTAKNRLTVNSLETTSAGVEAEGNKGRQTLPAANVQALRTAADQEAFDKAQNPNWAHQWVVGLSANLGIASAASSSEQMGAAMKAVRQTKKDETMMYFNSLYGRSNASGKYVDTANTIGGGLRYDHNVSPKFFYFGSSDFLNDQLQFLDLRSVLNGGMGRHAFAKKSQTLDIFAGGGWTHEQYSGVPGVGSIANSFGNFDVGENYTAKIGHAGALTESFAFNPVLSGSNTGNYQFNFVSGYTTKVAGIFNWTTNFTDAYTSFPPAGVQGSSLTFTTGIGISLSRK